jgi:hypothetical protein
MFSELLNELRYAANTRMVLEVCAIKLCHPAVSEQTEAIFARLEKLENVAFTDKTINPVVIKPVITEPILIEKPVTIETPPPAQKPRAKKKKASPATEDDQPAAPVATTFSAELFKTIKKSWTDFCQTFPPLIKMTLQRCGIAKNGEALQIICSDEVARSLMADKQTLIKESLAKHFGLRNPLNLDFIVGDSYNSRDADVSVGSDALTDKEEEDLWAAFGEQIGME